MNLTITDNASTFYKQELNLSEGDSLSFFVRVGGVGSGGFSVGISFGLPDTDYRSKEQHGIFFCVAEDDQWYFDGMVIDYQEDYGEVTFENKRLTDVINPN
ncbi:iron-sulfur cluster biosynthesis family protein [Salipaludibacillus sp. HK11]|uniref:iron-sulfur cluster biosynthesis family protein n=1 Tax=Salipaludibacillus sp. HK11 TaxID=3394320 RepID=UPI0039FC0163